MAKLDNRVIENAKLMFRNFGGRAGLYNQEGERSFLIFLDPEKAEEMREEGWNVKKMRTRDEGDIPQDYLPVAVEYNKGRPPRIVIITDKTNVRTEVTESDTEVLMQLDYATIVNADIMLNPYEWTVNGNTGIKAYLKTAYLTVYEDELDLKYAMDPTTQSPSSSSTVNDEELVDA